MPHNLIQIKMVGEMSVEKACGQILFCLKMSNLNYMVKETPFSAYVTIRKKFVKNSETVGNYCEQKSFGNCKFKRRT